jgi:hypothetical protein
VLSTADATYAHSDLLSAAERVVDEYDLSADDRVGVRASLAHPGTVVAGVVAPLLASGVVVLPGEEAAGTVSVATGSAPEDRVIDPSDAAP